MNEVASSRRQQWRAAACIVIGPCCFALSALFTKRCGPRVSSWQKVQIRSLINLFLTFFTSMILRTKLKPKELTLLALRGGFGCMAICCYYESLNHIPVGRALMLSRFHPLVSGSASSYLLSEPFTVAHLVAIAVSLVGVCGVVDCKAKIIMNN